MEAETFSLGIHQKFRVLTRKYANRNTKLTETTTSSCTVKISKLFVSFCKNKRFKGTVWAVTDQSDTQVAPSPQTRLTDTAAALPSARGQHWPSALTGTAAGSGSQPPPPRTPPTSSPAHPALGPGRGGGLTRTRWVILAGNTFVFPLSPGSQAAKHGWCALVALLVSR